MNVVPASQVTSVIGQEVGVNCTGSGSGQLEITWTKDNTIGEPCKRRVGRRQACDPTA